jgi:hypothetical protein
VAVPALRQSQQLAAQVAQLQDQLRLQQERSAQQLAALAQASAQVGRFKAQWQQEFDRRRRLHDQVGAGPCSQRCLSSHQHVGLTPVLWLRRLPGSCSSRL